jgi:hypothetical protein
VTDLQTAFNKINEPREIDKLFHQRISTVEAKLDGISYEVKLAVSDLMEGVGEYGIRVKEKCKGISEGCS